MECIEFALFLATAISCTAFNLTMKKSVSLHLFTSHAAKGSYIYMLTLAYFSQLLIQFFFFGELVSGSEDETMKGECIQLSLHCNCNANYSFVCLSSVGHRIGKVYKDIARAHLRCVVPSV